MPITRLQHIENSIRPRIEQQRRELPDDLFLEWLQEKIEIEQSFQAQTQNKDAIEGSKQFEQAFAEYTKGLTT